MGGPGEYSAAAATREERLLHNVSSRPAFRVAASENQSGFRAGDAEAVVIGYIGLSLSVPERVRYRHKLEEFDRDWSEPTSAREAIYTNLSPREYRFHVIASNAAGIWSNPETLDLKVEATVWQSWWSRLASQKEASGLWSRRFRLSRATWRFHRSRLPFEYGRKGSARFVPFFRRMCT